MTPALFSILTPLRPETRRFVDYGSSLGYPDQGMDMIRKLDRLGRGLVNEGLLQDLVSVKPIWGGSAGWHSINYVDPTRFQSVFSGTVTHDASGELSNGTTGYADESLNPSTTSPLSTTNFSQGLYINLDGSDGTDRADCGSSTGSSASCNIHIRLNTTSNLAIFDSFSFTTGRASVANTSALGFFVGTRGTGAGTLYKNGVSIAAQAGVAGTVPNANLFLLARNGSGTATQHSKNRVAFYFVGGHLTLERQLALFNIVQMYQSNMGRA